MKYRIVKYKYGDQFKIQERFLFNWSDVRFLSPPFRREFDTRDEAQKIISKWKLNAVKKNKSNWEPIK